MKKTGFYIIKDIFLRTCLIHILKEIRQETDLIIIDPRILIREYFGWYHYQAE